MILVDSSVWIDYFNGTATPQVAKLDTLLGTEDLLIGDIILTEVLQGFALDAEFNEAKRFLMAFPVVGLVGQKVAVQAARNYRYLRVRGITVRKTIDTIIATFCIEEGLQLLHNDRDFEPFVEHLGLQPAWHAD